MLHFYRYKGVLKSGLKRNGNIIAHSEIGAAEELLANGITIFSIKKVSKRMIYWKYKIGSLLKLYTNKDRFVLWWIQELTDLLKSGLSITKAVESTACKINNEYQKIILYQVHQLLLSGSSFSSAAEKAKLFSKIEVVLTYSAERNGSLLEALTEMHQHLTQRQLSKSRRSVVVIPLLILMIPTVLLSHYVANNILSVYVFDLWMQNKSVPVVGKLFLWIYSGDMTKKILFLIAFIILAHVAITVFFKIPSKKTQHLKERIVLMTPFKKAFIKKYYSVYFLSSLSFALKSNLPLHQAFFQCASVVQFLIFKQEILLACRKIYDGIPTKQVLSNISFLDPGDKLMLQTCLDSYSVDNTSIHHLLHYTYVQLRNFDIYSSTLINSSLVSILIFLISFAIAAAFNIIIVCYA
jgi:type IV pilus assembly protein PilC